MHYSNQQDASTSKAFLGQPLLHVSPPQPSKTAHHKSTLVNPKTAQKSQCRQQQKSQCRKLGLQSNSPEFLDFSAQMYGLLKSDFWQKLEVKQPRVDHGQHWSTLQQKALDRSAEKQQLRSTHVRGKGLQRLSNQSDHNESV